MKQSYTLYCVNNPDGSMDYLAKPFGNLIALQHWVFKNYPYASSYQIIVIQHNGESKCLSSQ